MTVAMTWYMDQYALSLVFAVNATLADRGTTPRGPVHINRAGTVI